MTYNDVECSVTISRQRYAELVVAEKDAQRLQAVICKCADNYLGLSYEELKVLRDLMIPREEAV